MTYRDSVQITLYLYGIDSINDTQILKPPHNILVNLKTLEYGRNPDIGTHKK